MCSISNYQTGGPVMQKVHKTKLKNIKHDLELMKEVSRTADKLSYAAKTKTLKRYIYEFDLSAVDRLLILAKGRLKDLGIGYKELGEFYRSVTGKDYGYLTRTFLTLFYIERNNFEEDFIAKKTVWSVEKVIPTSE